MGKAFIAVEKDGTIKGFRNKPVKVQSMWAELDDNSNVLTYGIKLDSNTLRLFKIHTSFELEPVEVDLTL